MFDIGFFEVLVIAVVGLLVIGPERLPETVRAIGLWLGRLKRSLRETRSELEKQIGADDIRRQLHNEEVMRSLESTRRQIEDAVQEGALPQDSPPQPKTKYREEEELPDHAHTQNSSTATPNSESTSETTDTSPSTDQKPSAENLASSSDTAPEPSAENSTQPSADKADAPKNHSQN